MQLPPVQSKTALVTGCSSGIGRATAEVLRTAGWQVTPTARRPADLDQLRADGFEPLALEMDSPESIASASRQVLDRYDGALGALVNNAGYGQPGAIEDLSREAMRAQFETNLFGLLELTNQFIPVLRAQGWGRIVNVSSVVGRVAVPFMGIYSASKFALEAASDALRVELHKSGIGVLLIEPGPIATSFSRRTLSQTDERLIKRRTFFGHFYERHMEQRRGERNPDDRFRLPPEAVAAKILRAVESVRPPRRQTITWPAHIGAFGARFFPDALIDAIMIRRAQLR